jgi:hypothetical protein
MRNRIVNHKPDVINNQKVKTLSNMGSKSAFLNESKAAFGIMSVEGREDFLNYLQALGLDKDPNLVFLYSHHHYYYDADEMKNVRTIVNLKEINHIKEIRSFLHSISRILTEKNNFIGCFVDNEKINGYVLRKDLSRYSIMDSTNAVENGIVSRIPFLNMVYSKMDSRTNKYMTRSSVSLLLEDHGFKVNNMSEINGLTYFHTQKVRTVNN